MAGSWSSPEGLGDPSDLLRALESVAGQAQWVPLFSDDFARSSLGEDWKIVGGQAHIENGRLRLSGKADCYAVIRRPFPDNIRIEFDARFPENQSYCSDLACFVGGDERSCDAVGYSLSFGADGNYCSRIQREGIDVRINTGLKAERGRLYRVAAELLDGELRLLVDGQPVLRYVDLVPLAGMGHDHLGLASFEKGCEFSGVRVLTRSGPASAGIFTIPDAYCRDGLFDKAIERYRQVVAAHQGESLALQAQVKVGLALMGAGRHGEAEAQLRSLSRQAQGTEMALLVDLWRGLALGMMGKIDDALRTFSQVESQASDSGVVDEVAVACGRLALHLRREERWLETGRCIKFLFENLKTPLIETNHMFSVYGKRLREAGLFEEEYQAANRLVAVLSRRQGDPRLADHQFGVVSSAISAGRVGEAGSILDGLQEESTGSGADPNLGLRVLGWRAILDLATGRYQKALERLMPLAGTKQEECQIGEARWGQTAADLRSTALALLGRMDEALEDLDAGRISTDVLDLRLALSAELWKRGHRPAATNCLAELVDAMFGRAAKFIERAVPAIRGEMPVEAFREYVDSELQPYLQPLGLLVAGLALWANGEEQAGMLSWSDAKNAAADTDPAWHWAGCFMGRAGK